VFTYFRIFLQYECVDYPKVQNQRKKEWKFLSGYSAQLAALEDTLVRSRVPKNFIAGNYVFSAAAGILECKGRSVKAPYTDCNGIRWKIPVMI